jgi:hypothetical protein
VTHPVDPATAQLRCRPDRVTARRHAAEIAACAVQHALAEELLRTVPSARQQRLIVDCDEHVSVRARIHTLTSTLGSNPRAKPR